MLQARNLSAVLAQSIHQSPVSHPSSGLSSHIFSSILCTSSGLPVASSHSAVPQLLKCHQHQHQNQKHQQLSQTDPSSFQLRSNSISSLNSHSSSNSSSSSSTSNSASTSTSTASSSYSMQYALDRPLKTKVYCLFASSLWSKFYRPSNNSQGKRNWVSVITDEALLVILPVHSASTSVSSSSSLQLLVLVAELGSPLGILLRKAQETVSVLEAGLQNYKICD